MNCPLKTQIYLTPKSTPLYKFKEPIYIKKKKKETPLNNGIQNKRQNTQM